MEVNGQESVVTEVQQADKPAGNEAFQTVLRAYKSASGYMRVLGPRKLTAAQQKIKSKNRAKRKLAKASRKANRR